MLTADFHYELPPDRIAATPTATRDESKLLVMQRRGDSPNEHAHFRDVGRYLPPRSLLVVNDTRVMAARLRGRKATGGGFELLLTRQTSDAARAGVADDSFDQEWEALGRSLGNVPLGSILEIGDAGALQAQLVARGTEGRVTVRLRGTTGRKVAELIEAVGEVPLPPYIEAARRETNAPAVDDRVRYQTVYADAPGAVAAPTAGLHFTPALLDELRAAGHELARVTLHVGPGTFRPVKTTDARAHEMDEERYTISDAAADAIARARAEGRPVIAVGTTVVRTLEAAARENGGVVKAGGGATRLFILPGDSFAVVDGLITNFHLPESTLLMLVCAFAGTPRVLASYREAVVRGYRFYSYGDAMLIPPARA